MPIIKSNQAPTSVSPFSMADIEAAARRMLLRARSQAEQLLAEAQAEADKMKSDATAQGSAEGLAQGRAEGLRQGLEEGRRNGHDQALDEYRPQLTELIKALSAAMQSIEESRRDLEASAVTEVAELAVAIARRIIKTRAADPEILQANLGEAMALVVGSADVRIQVHPAQKELLEAELPHLNQQWPNLKHIELIGDESVSPGGCRLGTAHGKIDADLNTQLDRIIGEVFGDVDGSE